MKVGRGAHRAISWCASRNIVGAPRAEGGLRRAVLEEIAGHPVISAGTGEVLDRFAEIAAMRLGATLARRAHQHDREARLEGHRDQRGLAVAGHAFDADLPGIYGGNSLEIVEGTGRAPSPGPQRAPLLGRAALALVGQADDAGCQSGAVVGLDAGGAE
jgi:hypothetical protein